jgi:hypothetical protein
VSGVEHSYPTGVKLDYQTLFGVDSNTVAAKFRAIENQRYSVAQLHT